MARASKSPDDFAAEMAQCAPEIELLGAYVNARTKVLCRCRTCGHVWEATPNHLLRGAGCPQCAGTRRKSGDAFAAQVKAIVPTVELVGAYVNARTRVACRCRVCGHEWSPLPKGLLQGNTCPQCAKRASVERLKHARDNQGAHEGAATDAAPTPANPVI